MKLSKDIRLFRRTRALEGEIDKFLDLMSEGGMLFKHAVHVYLDHGPCDEFEDKLQQVNKIESLADDLREYRSGALVQRKPKNVPKDQEWYWSKQWQE